jgi:hypothetical protein
MQAWILAAIAILLALGLLLTVEQGEIEFQRRVDFCYIGGPEEGIWQCDPAGDSTEHLVSLGFVPWVGLPWGG